MAIEPNETLISGDWLSVDGRMVPDDSQLRIRRLVETELEKIGSANDGWEILFRDRSDGRLWELFYPHSEMQGGGPESLRMIDAVHAAQKYGFKVDAPTSPSQPEIDFAGMTTNERLYVAGLTQEWDAAAQSLDREKMVEVLFRIGLGNQANHIAGQVIANPRRYGL
ncbi:MAG: Imm27 family immunity protein [Terracidiphilus sp.]